MIILLRKMSILILSCVCLIIHSANAQSIGFTVDANPQLSYQPFSGLAASEVLQVELNLPDSFDELGGGQKNLRFRIRPALGGAFVATNNAQRKLPISLQANNSGRRLRDFNNEYYSDFSIDERSEKNMFLEFLVVIAPSIYAPPGLYNLKLELDLLETPSNIQLTSPQIIELDVLVGARLQTNIAGTRSSASGVKLSTIDFDTLETGESRQVFIQIRGNAPANITISSENRGRLRMEKTDNSFIPYSVEVDGENSTLEAPLNLQRPVAQNLRGSAYPMTVKIGDVNGAFAGQYQDVLTVEVRPQ